MLGARLGFVASPPPRGKDKRKAVDMTFIDCVLECASVPEFVAEFDRLSGTHLSKVGQRSGLDALIDESTGRDNDAMQKFTAFVFAYIWLPMIGS